jgi:hypothetical protein
MDKVQKPSDSKSLNVFKMEPMAWPFKNKGLNLLDMIMANCRVVHRVFFLQNNFYICHGGRVLMLPGSPNNKQVQITIYMLLFTQQQTPLTCWHVKTCLPQRTEWTMYITQYPNLYSYHFTYITIKLIVSKLNLTKLSTIHKQCTRWQLWEATGYGRAIWIH